MSWISKNADRKFGEKILVDDQAPKQLAFQHILTTLELRLKCQPLSMFVEYKNGHQAEYVDVEKMIRYLSASFNEILTVVDAIHLDYYTYRESFTPDEYVQKVMKGFYPV